MSSYHLSQLLKLAEELNVSVGALPAEEDQACIRVARRLLKSPQGPQAANDKRVMEYAAFTIETYGAAYREKVRQDFNQDKE